MFTTGSEGPPPQMLLLVMRANDVSGGPCLLISLNGGLIEVRERN